jgi:hypothetical protein
LCVVEIKLVVDGEAITRIGDVRPGGDAPEMTIVTNSAAGDDPR